ncbi:RE1 [Symbiodinium sp. CCMP2592]|nr:RE1 [Symbiodinium sp. CCMP2592]
MYLEYKQAIYLNTRAFLEYKQAIYLNTRAFLEYKQAIYLNTRAFLEYKQAIYLNTRAFLEYKQAIYLNTRAFLEYKQAIYLNTRAFLEYKQAIYLNTQAFLRGTMLMYLEYKQAIYLNTRAFLEYKQAIYLNTRAFLEYKQAIYLNTRAFLEYKQAIYLNTRAFLEYKQAIYLNTRAYLVVVGDKPDHIALLAGGMAQLQQAMLQQLSSKEKGEDASPEAVKPGTNSLPSLPAVSASTSSIDIADWLEMLDAPMSDLSDGSSAWWSMVRQRAGASYEKWTNAGPMEKLSIALERDGALEGGRWSRVNSRAASMMMLALHESVRSEMVEEKQNELAFSTISNVRVKKPSRLKWWRPYGVGCVVVVNDYNVERSINNYGSRYTKARAKDATFENGTQGYRTYHISYANKNFYDTGGNHWRKCPFLHSWEGLEKEKSSRCLACGGKHMVKDCINKKGGSPTAASAAKAPPQVKAAATPGPTSSTSSTTSNKNVRIEEGTPADGASAAQRDLGTADLKEVLADVGKMLKAMSATSLKRATVAKDALMQRVNSMAQVFAAQVGGATEDDEEQGGLLDSGASNAMRPANPEEYQSGIPVKVTLAGEEERILRQNRQGTVLVEEKDMENSATQPIVPLGALVQDLGCSLVWKRGQFRLMHPYRGQLRVKVRNNCPEVTLREANMLIKELEENQVAQLTSQVDSLTARLEVMRMEEKQTWDELLKAYLESGNQGLLQRAVMLCPFTKDIPADAQAMLVTSFDPDGGEKYMKELPITRRRRRLLMASESWVIRLFAGEGSDDDGFVKAASRNGRVVLNVDKANSKLWDINGLSPAYKLMLWAASKGKIADVIGSPPETTWTTSTTPLRGPGSVHVRTKDYPYGVPEFSPLRQARVNKETACCAKQLLIWTMSMMKGRRNVGFLMEFPADEVSPLENAPNWLSFWKTEMWKSFKSVSGTKQVTFNQGAYGHEGVRPTSLATTYPMLTEIDGEVDVPEGCVPTSLLSKKTLRSWSDDFKWMVSYAMMDYVPSRSGIEEEMDQCGAKIQQADEGPTRSVATGYQHRRRKHPQLYTLALDLAGPFKVSGRDMDFDDYKYIMVAAYRCPKEYIDAKSHDEMVKEFEMDEYEPSEGEEDDLMEPIMGDGAPVDVETDDDKKEPMGPATLDEAVEELTELPEWTTLYITRAMRRRTKTEALRAAREIVLQLKMSGLYVSTVHTDRAREFSSLVFKEWLAESGLRHTRTSGGEPAGNSTAELGVRWAKNRVRALLKGAKAEPKDWPLAISQASASTWARAFPYSPTARLPAAPFGQEIWFRSKGYKGAAEMKHDPSSDRWKKGWYRGPAMDVSRGHVILREDGGLTVAKSVKFNVIDPAKEFPDLFLPGEADGVQLRDGEEVKSQSKRELRDEIEFLARRKLEEQDFGINGILQIYERLEELGDTDMRIGKKAAVTSWKAGTRLNLREYPYATKLLAGFGKKYAGGRPFTALGIARNANLGIHRDSHNARFSENIIVPITDFKGGGLWLEQSDGEDAGEKRELPNGQIVYGNLVKAEKGKPICFPPRRWHQVQPWQGDRVTFLMYTPRGTKLSEKDMVELETAGFPIDRKILQNQQDEEECNEVQGDEFANVKTMNVERTVATVDAFVEIEEGFVERKKKPWQGDWERLPDPDGRAKLKKIVKKAEVQYTANIEAILQDHIDNKKPLEVTHTVSLGEVRKALKQWAPSAEKEYNNLVHGKKAFRPVKFRDLPAECRIVPWKGVFTVKPEGNEEGFKRKTRFVACGNHLEEGALTEADYDVYAAGIDASSLRTMLAYKTTKPTWGAAVTDIRQAFVLAPWIGRTVALKPPALAVEMGLAEPDDYWLVEKSIYGLREAPAAWATFRDNELRAARWETEVDGEKVELKLQQLVSDDQVWKVVRSDESNQEALGYLLVYVDDLMIMGSESVMGSFFEWVSNKWECDALSVLSEENNLKFLGMELHYVNGGIEVCQEGFIRELLRAHQHNGARSKTQGAKETLIMSAEEEAMMIEGSLVNLEGKEHLVKEAQRRVGELLWLSSRSRPDIQYATAVMASRITRCPEAVITIGDRLLDYLNETMYDRLRFANDNDELQTLRTYTDSSFAPSSGKSHGSVAIFYGSCPLTWRSSRQPLVALSTAETELMEAVEGAVVSYSTKCLIEELLDKPLHITLHVDNSAAISLMTTASGTWRTRHLRLRANWIKEKILLREVAVVHEPGTTQRADIGTKPFNKDRLQQLKDLWDIKNRRPVQVKSMKALNTSSLMKGLMVLSQICGAKGKRDDIVKEEIQTEVPWDLYIVIIIMAIAVIGLWEACKHCLQRQRVNVKTLRAKAAESSKKLTRNDLKELQVLMSLVPQSLSDEQKLRLFDLKELFDSTMPSNTSPLPTTVMEGSTQASSSASSSSIHNKKPKDPPKTREQGVQKDPPAFERVPPPPPQQVRVFAGPYYQTEGSSVLHVYENCWGLRNTNRQRQVQLCRCCAENNGNRIY